MKLKIHGGTRSGPSLCYTCANSHIRRGAAYGQEVVRCSAASYDTSELITYPIVECNDYKDRNLPSLSDLRKIATYISADRRTGRIGFETPEDRRKKQSQEAEEITSPFDP